jgi:phosphomannomutase / phosphoglucomutase
MAQKSFWGKYDIRAIVSEDFGATHYRQLGQTYANFLHRQLGSAPHWVCVGYDARLHSPELADALIQGLQESGINVANLGLSTSPIVYFSEHLHTMNASFPLAAGTIMVTASHNPSEYNGVKFTYQKRTMEESEFLELQELYKALPAQSLPEQCIPGEVKKFNVIPDYRTWFEQQFGQIGSGIKIVVDSGNATAGIVAPDLLRQLGCEVVDIFTEPDGRFPNHHPDPCVHKNLVHLIDEVIKTGADFGVAFDGDSDRLGIVDNKGRIMPGDQITLFLTEDVLTRQPGATVAFDIKSTQTLFEYIQTHNGNALLAPSGHAYMKRLMKEQDIPLGGELSGHIFFRDRHWGFDDALYAACRFAESFAHRRQNNVQYTLSDFVAALPQTKISEEKRISCTYEEGKQWIAHLKDTLEKDKGCLLGSQVTDVLTLDGLRANIKNGFFLVRSSGTEPCITIRYEAPDEKTYYQIEKNIEEIFSSLTHS